MVGSILGVGFCVFGSSGSFLGVGFWDEGPQVKKSKKSKSPKK